MGKTKVGRTRSGIPVDACSGDSGGPLLKWSDNFDAFVLHATLNGGGYDCVLNTTDGDGVWNSVFPHTKWIDSFVKGFTPAQEDMEPDVPLLPAPTGKIALQHSSSLIGDILYEGSVFLDGKPVCDNAWGHNEALVACRSLATIGPWLAPTLTLVVWKKARSLPSVTSGAKETSCTCCIVPTQHSGLVASQRWLESLAFSMKMILQQKLAQQQEQLQLKPQPHSKVPPQLALLQLLQLPKLRAHGQAGDLGLAAQRAVDRLGMLDSVEGDGLTGRDHALTAQLVQEIVVRENGATPLHAQKSRFLKDEKNLGESTRQGN